MDNEPPDDIQAGRLAANREIGAWVQREYGLKPTLRQIAYVRRKHPGAMRRGHGKPFSEGATPVEIPSEFEAAVEAALWHFGMI